MGYIATASEARNPGNLTQRNNPNTSRTARQLENHIPVRFHLNNIISHLVLSKFLTFDQLQTKICSDFSIRLQLEEELTFKYKKEDDDKDEWVNITDDQSLRQAFEYFEASGNPKFELFAEY